MEPLIEGTKYARQCSVTNKPMNEGWVIEGAGMYFKNEQDVREWVQENWSQTLEEAFEEDEQEDESNVYWTQWEEDDYQYTVKNGKLIEIQ